MANQLMDFQNIHLQIKKNYFYAAPSCYTKARCAMKQIPANHLMHQPDAMIRQEAGSVTKVVLPCLFIKKKTRFKRVDFEDILWIQAQGNYSVIQTTEEKFMNCLKLWQIEAMLSKDIFMRVHRSYIVNLNHVSEFEGNTLYVGTHQIPVSKTCREDVLKHFQIIN